MTKAAGLTTNLFPFLSRARQSEACDLFTGNAIRRAAASFSINSKLDQSVNLVCGIIGLASRGCTAEPEVSFCCLSCRKDRVSLRAAVLSVSGWSVTKLMQMREHGTAFVFKSRRILELLLFDVIEQISLYTGLLQSKPCRAFASHNWS